jgi:hypothetical protein
VAGKVSLAGFTALVFACAHGPHKTRAVAAESSSQLALRGASLKTNALRMSLKRFWPSLSRARRAAGDPARNLAAIERWTAPATGPIPATPVHVVSSGSDWRLAAWMLASWCHFTESRWKIVIHDDGTLTDEAAAALQKILPEAGIIRRREADAALAPTLREFPFCETLRSDDPAALKIFDARNFCAAEQLFIFDSDVLFFGYPRELTEWVEEGGDECRLLSGDEECSLIAPKVAREELGVQLWPRADSGICLLQKSALDLDFIDRVLAQTPILHGPLTHATQTLLMLCAARTERGGLLPPRYEVSPERGAATDPICRHYPRTRRKRFPDDALNQIAPHLFPPEEPRADAGTKPA